jgi:hypothetical protein
MLGTNDSKSYNWMVGTGTRAQQFVNDYSAMVDHFASLPTHPLVYLALPPRAFANSYGIDGTIIHDQILPLIQQVATQKRLPIIDVDTPTASHSELFPDGVHPNDTGYALVAQVMYTGLLSMPNADGGVSPEGGAADAANVDGAIAEAGIGRDGGSGGASSTGGAADASSRATDDGGTGAAGSGAAGASAGSTGGSVRGAGGAEATGSGGAPGSSDSGCSCGVAAGRGSDFGGVALVLALMASGPWRTRSKRRRQYGDKRAHQSSDEDPPR